MIFFIIFCKFFCARTFYSTILYKIVLIFFNYYFLYLKGEEKKVFFSRVKIFWMNFFVFCLFLFFWDFFFVVFIFFFGGNKYPTNKGMCSLFSLHNLVFKKSNQAKNSLITIVTSKNLKNVQAEWQQRNGWNFREINFTKIFVKLISRKKMVSSACTFFKISNAYW